MKKIILLLLALQSIASAQFTTSADVGTFLQSLNTAAMRTNLGLGTLATQSGTFSGISSGTNTGDQTTITGNAGTATIFQTARTINGTSFNGSSDITITAAAGTLTGATLNATVTGSSLTSVGTLTSLGVSGNTAMGTTTGLATATPLTINMGGTYGNSGDGAVANLKLILSDITGTRSGIGMVANRIEYQAWAGAGHRWFNGGTPVFDIDPAGLVSVSGNMFVGGTATLNGTTWAAAAAYSYGAGSAAAHRTALGVLQSGIRRTLYVNAGAMIARTTNGAATGTVELGTNDIMQDSFDFDTTTEEGVGFWTTLPSAYNASTITLKFHWTAASSSGTVKWDVAGRCFADDDAMDQALGTEQTASADTLSATGDMHVTGTTPALTMAGAPAANRPCYFQITRDVAGDTLAADAKLLGVTIEYTELTTEPSAQ